ncbi:hemerythrin family protein [bacterium]|nr:hemerythrin family protein [bacterium]
MFFKWSDSYSVKILSVDREHQKLFDIINEFYDQLMTKQAKQLIVETLANLSMYTKTHFRNEELLMQKYGYPKYAEHKTLHEQYVAKIDEYKEKIAANKIVMTHELATFLKDWLLNHVLKIDKQYSSFFDLNIVK